MNIIYLFPSIECALYICFSALKLRELFKGVCTRQRLVLNLQDLCLISCEIRTGGRDCMQSTFVQASKLATSSHPLQVSRHLHSYPQGPRKMHTHFKGALYFTHITFTTGSIQGRILFYVYAFYSRNYSICTYCSQKKKAAHS